MGILVKHGGIWKDTDPTVKDKGIWKSVDEAWVNDRGLWKQAYSRISPGTVIGGDIVAGRVNDYWVLVAPATGRLSQLAWGLYNIDTTLPNTERWSGSVDPNTGQYNTAVLVNNYANTQDSTGVQGSPAANACFMKGYALPNKNELEVIFENRAQIDAADTTGGAYTLAAIEASRTGVWSSTEMRAAQAYFHAFYPFSDPVEWHYWKNNQYWVLPIKTIAA